MITGADVPYPLCEIGLLSNALEGNARIRRRTNDGDATHPLEKGLKIRGGQADADIRPFPPSGSGLRWVAAGNQTEHATVQRVLDAESDNLTPCRVLLGRQRADSGAERSCAVVLYECVAGRMWLTHSLGSRTESRESM